MPKWRDLRRYLEHNAKFLRHGGEHDLYIYQGKILRVSRSSGEIDRKTWKDILKNQLCITLEEFKAGI